ncbi:MAG TPA: hypothetical protein VH396_17540 [Chitinophagaceae bacterium]|jgi:hypothetical protein
MDYTALQAVMSLILFGLIIGGVILFIIDSGRQARKKLQYMEAQIRLLMQIAAANGVNHDKIAEIVAGTELPEFKNRK